MHFDSDVGIIGAGPYALSCSAHFTDRGIDHIVFGSPMKMWRENMPPGMCMKSDGFACTLYDPQRQLTLRQYCAERDLAYADLGRPVPVETFIDYGLAFQARLVPHLDRRLVKRLRRIDGGFALRLEDDREVTVRRVVVATGIDYFRHIPTELTELPPELMTHSAEYGDVTRLAGQKIAIIGRGASAIDLAMLGHEAGAAIELVARTPKIAFHPPPPARRGPRTRLRYPTSGIGPGWRNVFYCKAPGLFRFQPHEAREEQVRNWLGPAPGWFTRQRAEGKFPVHLGSHVVSAEAKAGGVALNLGHADGTIRELQVDHVIAATGFTIDIARLPFLDAGLKKAIATYRGAPVLTGSFSSSVPDLYFIGPVAALTFGPVMRFAVGASYTARRLSRHLVHSPSKRWSASAEALASPSAAAE